MQVYFSKRRTLMKKFAHILLLSLALLASLPTSAFADGTDPTPTKPPVGNAR